MDMCMQGLKPHSTASNARWGVVRMESTFLIARRERRRLRGGDKEDSAVPKVESSRGERLRPEKLSQSGIVSRWLAPSAGPHALLHL